MNSNCGNVKSKTWNFFTPCCPIQNEIRVPRNGGTLAKNGWKKWKKTKPELRQWPAMKGGMPNGPDEQQTTSGDGKEEAEDEKAKQPEWVPEIWNPFCLLRFLTLPPPPHPPLISIQWSHEPRRPNGW